MRRAFVRGLALSAVSSAAVAATGLVRTVIIAKVMGPAAFGLWRLCLVALRFAPESHGGALHAVAFGSPVHRGAGRDEEARALETRATAISLVHGLVFALVAGVTLRTFKGPELSIAAVLLAAACLTTQWFNADAVVLRSRLQFGRLALLQGVFAVSHLAGLLYLVPRYYVSGALAAWAGSSVLSLVLVRVATRDPLPSLVPRHLSWAPVRKGVAAWLVDLQPVALLQADSIVIAIFLGARAVGFYGMLPLAASLVFFLPDILSRVLVPYAGERFGASGLDATSLRPFALGALRGLAPVLAAGTLLSLQGMDLLVAHVLPNFAAALEPVRWYLPGAFFIALLVSLRPLLVTVGRGRDLFRVQLIIGILTVMVQTFVATRSDRSMTDALVGVAQAGSAGAGLLFFVTLGMASRTFHLGADAVRIASWVAALLAGAMCIDAALVRWGGDIGASAGAMAVQNGVPAVLGWDLPGWIAQTVEIAVRVGVPAVLGLASLAFLPWRRR